VGAGRAAPEVESKLDGLLRRFRELGATPDEIEQVALNWATDTDDWGQADRDLMVGMSDGSLLQLLAGVRAEWKEHHAGP